MDKTFYPEITRSVLLSGVHLSDLLGANESLLGELERAYQEVNFHLRDHLLTLRGTRESVAEVERAVLEILAAHKTAAAVDSRDIKQFKTTSLENGKKLPESILTVRGRGVRPQTAGQRDYVKSLEECEIVFCEGPAGTGKTYLAVAFAVRALQRREVAKIVLTRPAVEAGEKLGYLPGSLEDKIDPYLRPLFDALAAMLDPETVAKLVESGAVEVAPLAYMRGRTLNESFIILDEAQNTTGEQMKMFLTRLGYASRMVITGDSSQVDLSHNISGLADAMHKLSNIPEIGITHLDAEDIVRNSLVSQIVAAYEGRL
ncbi:PhoH family protein [Canibacter sp. lx-45]|uniref:PhoH family protein n=1 Tax=Canibacter zhuwentaonis TaxID=2837491 RepID=UPI001BDD7C5E|nr:PhoH family protein [Canibacter zhuwentaonis]